MDEMVKKKISNSLKGKMSGENHPMYGKHHSVGSRKFFSIKAFCKFGFIFFNCIGLFNNLVQRYTNLVCQRELVSGSKIKFYWIRNSETSLVRQFFIYLQTKQHPFLKFLVRLE